jgi:drug/metabolite transporter (DMT)-like permease
MAGILLKRALVYSRPLPAALISVTATAAFVWIAAAVTVPLERLLTPRVIPFLIAGIVAPGLSRLAVFTGVDRIGVARSTVLVSTSPLFGIAMAILFLGERPSWMLLVGAVCVVTGGVLLARRGHAEKPWRRRDLVLPLLGALGFAFRDNLSRWALVDFPEPMVGAAAATLSSLGVMWAVGAAQWGRGTIEFDRVGLAVMLLSGCFEGVAYVAMWRALEGADVSVVTPLVHSQPLFTIALTVVFLRDIERITWRIVLSAGAILTGVILVIRFR